MTFGECVRIDSLERRTLLAHIGLDFDFGHLGRVTVGSVSPATLESVRLVSVTPMPGGKILVVTGKGARRLNVDGTTDRTFSDAGAASAGKDAVATSAVVKGSRLIIIGRMTKFGGGDVFVRAIDVNTGAADTSFGGGDGIAMFAPPSVSNALTIDRYFVSFIVTSDGGLLFAVDEQLHQGTDPLTYGSLLLKLEGDGGQRDAAFGNNGVIILNTGVAESDQEPSLTADPGDGFLLLLNPTDDDPATLERRHNDGTIDTSFGDTGVLQLRDVSSIRQLEFPSWGPIVLQPDRKILIPVEDAQDFDTFGYLYRLNTERHGGRDLRQRRGCLLRRRPARQLSHDRSVRPHRRHDLRRRGLPAAVAAREV
jgi:hypothetical protein